MLAAVAAGAAVLVAPGAYRVRGPTPARRPPPVREGPGVGAAVVIELVAAALSCGLPPGAALAAVARAAGGRCARDLQPVVDALRLGADAAVAWGRAAPEHRALARTMLLAERTGAAAAAALRRAAVDERAARRRRAQVAARRLGVRLVLPLGLATLPSFVLLGVVPVVLGLATELLAG